MTDLRIIVDGDERNVATGTTAADLWPDTNPPKVVAARVGGELKDLAYALADGDAIEPVADRVRRTAARSCATRPPT